jgi:hypothetical protein
MKTLSCYYNNLMLLSWQRYHVIMKPLSWKRYQVIMATFSCYYVVMTTLSCHRDKLFSPENFTLWYTVRYNIRNVSTWYKDLLLKIGWLEEWKLCVFPQLQCSLEATFVVSYLIRYLWSHIKKRADSHAAATVLSHCTNPTLLFLMWKRN